ncbi:serine/threonine protein kinase [Lujinxingia vulgaris]|uniref:Serine/threonine protein kinase n=1 Tax=Lujinxingia vulgaris TaxID=2600176 RepID=A0A5C6XHL9_9DELT|nr:serine/threonine-protein kinase [Lujinxingia vulgaris]TXD37662.1 serine/threonine protein kinase [Lujinxingia vulgaris]
MSPIPTPETIAERYELIEELGQGGMATVFRAFDRTLGREVALKRLHPHLAKVAEHRARFEREARAVARLDHPGIVKIYDFSSPQTDDAYIVMELVDGESLATILERCGPLPAELAGVLIAKTLRALDVAHQHHIIHRDLKPENIMVRSDASVVLLDFGLANLLDQARITRTGALLGSPAYMAPELMEGGRADVASDLFSIGATFYRLVTGQDAFQGQHPAQILRAIEHGDHTPAHRLQPEAGRRFSLLISRWMSVSPDHRPANARAALEEIQPLFDEVSWQPHLKQHINKTKSNTSGTSETNNLPPLQDTICDALLGRADALIEQGQTLEATYELERVLAYQPDSQAALSRLSSLHAGAGEKEGSRRRALGMGAAVAALAAAGALWHAGLSPTSEAPAARASSRNLAPQRNADEALAQPKTTEAPAPPVDWSVPREEVFAALQDARRSAAASVAPSASAPDLARVDSVSANPPPARTRRVPAVAAVVDAPTQDTPAAPQTFKQRFRVMPAAATLSIAGKRYSAIEAARGIELPAETIELEASSPGCAPLKTTIDVSEESSQRAQRVVLSWLPGYIELVTDRDALVWLEERTSPLVVSAGGASGPIEVPFGRADEALAERQLEVRVASRHDLTRTFVRTVTVRPGQTSSLALSLADAVPQR